MIVSSDWGVAVRIVSALVVIVVATAGCGLLDDGVEGAVDQARARADGLLASGQELATTFEWCAGAAELGQAVVAGDVEVARSAASTLLEDAPDDLTTDLRTVAEAAARAQVGDPRDLLDDDVQGAGRNVYAYAVDLCGVSGGDG